jgi:DNA-directed RNA polymerase subunit F
LAITIPNRYKLGLLLIAGLDDDSFREIYEALEQAPEESFSEKDLADKVAERTQRLGPDDVLKIVTTLASLYQVRRRSKVSSPTLANDLYDAIRNEYGEQATEERWGKFKERIGKFLVLKSLNVLSAKAKELQSDVERYLCDARILTDLRPVFRSEVDLPQGVIVVHTLKLAYHDAATGRHEELFVSIDNDDIEKLKEILKRAEEKTKSLTSKLQISGVRMLNLS